MTALRTYVVLSATPVCSTFGGERAEEEIGESGVNGSVAEERPLAQRYGVISERGTPFFQGLFHPADVFLPLVSTIMKSRSIVINLLYITHLNTVRMPFI